MNGLTFNDQDLITTVRLEGKIVGHIMKRAYKDAWFYQPKGAGKKFAGPDFDSRAKVKESLKVQQ